MFIGAATGDPAKPSELYELSEHCGGPILIGSGVELENLEDYYEEADAVIVGSYFKKDGKWNNHLQESRVMSFMDKVKKLRK